MPRKTQEELKREEALARRRARRDRKKATQDEARRSAALSAIGAIGGVDAKVLRSRNPHSTTPIKMREARENLTDAFELVGGVPALVLWGKKNPTEFYRIWSRLITKEAADASNALPLETLLGKLAARAEQSVIEAAIGVGDEILAEGKRAVNLEDAVAAFGNLSGETVQ